MAKIVLHIGAHKTGTSYLQSLFHFNQDVLAAAGIFYPRIGTHAHGQHSLSKLWLTDLPLHDPVPDNARAKALWEELILRPYADRPGTLFLSSETFSRVMPQKVDMADLAQRLKAFDAVKIIYTVRRQSEMIPSIWAQRAKNQRPTTLRPFVEAAYTQAIASGVALDHGAIYDHLRTGFAPDQIHLLNYDQIKVVDGGIGQSFLDLLQTGLKLAALKSVPKDFANITPDSLALFVASQITDTAPAEALLEIIRAIVHPNPATPATLLARHEHLRIRKRFAPLNRALMRRVQPAQPEFSFVDPAPPEDMLYRDDVTVQHWAEIATALYRMSSEPDRPGRARQLLRRALGQG